MVVIEKRIPVASQQQTANLMFPPLHDEEEEYDREPVYTADDIVDRMEDWKRNILPLMEDEGQMKVAIRQSRKLQDSIRSRIAALAKEGNFEEARNLLDQVYDLHQGLLEIVMYHPLISNDDPDQVSDVCELLLKHNLHVGLPTLRLIARAWQLHAHSRRLVQFMERCLERGQTWTMAMTIEMIKFVWPAQGKRYLEERIMPTQNKSRIRQAVEIILWKYRALVSKSGGNRNEMYRTVRIAHNFYDRAADRLKGLMPLC
jgi:hypothetical protein